MIWQKAASFGLEGLPCGRAPSVLVPVLASRRGFRAISWTWHGTQDPQIHATTSSESEVPSTHSALFADARMSRNLTVAAPCWDGVGAISIQLHTGFLESGRRNSSPGQSFLCCQ